MHLVGSTVLICLKPVITHMHTFNIWWGLKCSKYTTESYFGHVPAAQIEYHLISTKKEPITETHMEDIPLPY
jgi:hypothetical protein